jgi:hypothetical protein
MLRPWGFPGFGGFQGLEGFPGLKERRSKCIIYYSLSSEFSLGGPGVEGCNQ